MSSGAVSGVAFGERGVLVICAPRAGALESGKADAAAVLRVDA